MSADIAVWLFFGLFTKHFVCDFLLQGPYQYLNKGTYGHPGGLLHSAIQAVGTIIVFFLLFSMSIPAALLVACVAMFEFLVHYHIDWAKMNINKHYALRPDTSEQFWWLLGFDQYLHYLTYFAIVWYITL